MKNLLKKFVLLWLLALCCSASAASNEFTFGVIAHPFKTLANESLLRKAISQADSDELAFVVASGIKSDLEPCSDIIYEGRKSIFDSTQNGLIVSLAASDWSECKNANGRSTAMERLNRLRDLFFSAEFSFGPSKIPMLRQSASPKFRSYGENARWEVNKLLFATINLPANNNHYLAAAGRNSEFEDRQLANRDWLQRLFRFATLKKLHGIVLFSDGNPLSLPTEQSGKRDGFLETRQQIARLAAKFPGKILIIHAQSGATIPTANNIVWQKNIGELELGAGWVKVRAAPSTSSFFIVTDPVTEARNTRQ